MPDLNVKDVIARLQETSGGGHGDQPWDGLKSGSLDAAVKGVAVLWAPGLAALQQAVARGCNLVLCKDPLYWYDAEAPASNPDSMYLRQPEGSMGPGKLDAIEQTATFRAKKEFIASHDLNIVRISEMWDGGQALSTAGLLHALGWKQVDSIVADARFPNTRTAIVAVPSQDLIQVAEHAKQSVASKATRVVGDKAAKVAKIAVHPGFLTAFAAVKIGRIPGLDLILTGEANEWEALVYCEDWITAGRGKGLVMVGLAPASDAAAKEVAAWVRKAVPSAKVEFVAVGDPLNEVRAGGLRA